jgi:hypothetical protein
MRQAITTRWHGPTDRLDARVKATCQAGSVTLVWDSNLGIAENHICAAEALLRKVGWLDATYHGGVLPNGDYAFVDDDGGVARVRS